MRITFRHSPHFDYSVYSNQLLEDIVDLLLGVRDIRLFCILASSIIDLNVYLGNVQSWLRDPPAVIKAHLNKPKVKQAIRLLLKLELQPGVQLGSYLSAIVPKYTMRKLENRFMAHGYNEVYICIECNNMRWDSAQRVGSNSVDAAIWDDSRQSRACYECKLDTSIKQEQIDFLYCIYQESHQKIMVGLASFASTKALEKHIANLNITRSIVKVLGREDLAGILHLPIGT